MLRLGLISSALLALPLALILATPAAAQDQTCTAHVNEQHLIIVEGTVTDRSSGWRERMTNAWNGRGRDGDYPVCDSTVTIAFIGRMMGLEDTADYCLTRADEDSAWLLAPGARNYRGECRRTTCEYVNMAADASGDILRRGAEIATGQEINDVGDGVTAVAGTAGTVMLTGQGGAIMNALGAGAQALTAAVSAPALLTAGAVTVVGVGGAVYLCRD
ncbi:hypothetical protein [Ketogulonicigenium vulgare]|uniref:Uncharacterized protein n=1 Tax=Ketogulonicigenium vulgare (strain WSH-001) TaxID=759362 RepID=F9Y3V5_KETVW|nr:hypothetical protein [Ketogulonicigenium vulgare]ADO43360.1 conserved hypothetical protein [Ketogulonicigenium vulgare Y25]AEM41646.1 hypothetical protein KVU_1807 [Ketogulonicigenium vulgare WSH-001]ALJ81759.1 hypothetical protein KVH_11655 [Ketogulonicigenium vulgare]ANW34419.1 hypothetical protein KvSKV_11570 [Ketogulonicigenium vulgare]AOZ55396.1 hypothetical protein KVC_2394 [Ketogulonicigenium vulgare]